MAITRLFSLKGPAPFMAIGYAPIVAYVLWMHFKNYNGSPLVLLVPAAFAVLTGFADRNRSPFNSAAFLCAAAFCIAIVDIVREVWVGELKIWEAPLAGAAAALWFASAIFVPTLLLVAVGRRARNTLSGH
jgi:hypothetical protein